MAWTTLSYRPPTVVIAKLSYASSAWWGFTSATDQKMLVAFILWSQRSRFVPPNLPSFADLCRTAEENLFDHVIANMKHVRTYFCCIVEL